MWIRKKAHFCILASMKTRYGVSERSELHSLFNVDMVPPICPRMRLLRSSQNHSYSQNGHFQSQCLSRCMLLELCVKLHQWCSPKQEHQNRQDQTQMGRNCYWYILGLGEMWLMQTRKKMLPSSILINWGDFKRFLLGPSGVVVLSSKITI